MRYSVPLIVLAVVLLGLVLGAYVVSRGPQKRPGTPASDFEARTVTIPIQGMTCASCTARVKRALSAIDGVIEVEVSLEHRHARVRYIDEKVSPERLAAAINELGYKAETPTAGRSQ